jgi:hypothetical protein
MKKLTFILTLLFPLLTTGQEKPVMGEELGILQFEFAEKTDKVVLLNEDLTEWMSFDFTYEERLNPKHDKGYSFDEVKKLYNWKEEFSPYVFHMDNFIIMFKCIEAKNDLYEVVVNKKTGLTKYIRKSKLWNLKSWKEHIVESVASIDLNLESNPLREKPDDNSIKIEIKKENLDPVISPEEIQGNWLKVKYWENGKEKQAWVKWRENNQIIVELWYSI